MSNNGSLDPRPAAVPSNMNFNVGASSPPNVSGPNKKKSSWGCLWLVLVVFGLIAIGSIAAQMNGSSSGGGEGSSSTATEPTKSASQLADEAVIAQGWKVYSSGEIYFKFADPSEYTCDYTGCAYAAIVSRSGCAGGFYAKIDVLNEAGTPIGWSNQISASAQPNEPVQVRFDVLEQNASNVRIAEISCLG